MAQGIGILLFFPYGADRIFHYSGYGCNQNESRLKKAELKFFPAYLWLVTKVLNEQQEFRIADQDGQIGYYDSLTPLYATFHVDDKTFSLCGGG